MDYYNEFDEYPLQWLRNLATAGHISDGTFDGRSIVDVKAEDLDGVRSAHFFAGIGGWPLALKLAGWPEDQEVWTGSCPCQPFSVAGSRKGKKDKRHLWPELFRLIGKRRPAVVFGEQVASADGRAWFAGVRADLESLGYVVGGADLCAAGAGEEGEGWVRRGDQVHQEPVLIGAPHIRQRLFWVAHAAGWNPSNGGIQRGREYGLVSQDGRSGQRAHGSVGEEALRMADPEHTKRRSELQEDKDSHRGDGSGGGGNSGGMADRQRAGLERLQKQSAREEQSTSERSGVSSGMDNAPGSRRSPEGEGAEGSTRNEARMRGPECGRPECDTALGLALSDGSQRGQGDLPKQAGAHASNPWSSFGVLDCADGKARRVESGTFPLVDGVPARVGKLRAYGNAIVPEEAAEFIQAFLECFPR